MTPEDTARIVNLIVSTWPTGPKGYVWTQALADLDAPRADRVYARLRDTVDRITVASYLETYRAQREPPTTRRRDPVPTCEHCAGCAYEPGPDEYETIGGERHTYATVVPCRCTRPEPRRPAVVTPSLLEDF